MNETDLVLDVNIEAGGWSTALGDLENILNTALKAALQMVEIKEPQAEVSVLLTDDEHQRALNLKWRARDKPTNVLSFPSGGEAPPPGQALMLGDISLAFETCHQEALDQNKSFSHHVSHLLVHGMLHLSGFDHKTETEAEEMEALEIEILQGIGLNNPYANLA